LYINHDNCVIKGIQCNYFINIVEPLKKNYYLWIHDFIIIIIIIKQSKMHKNT